MRAPLRSEMVFGYLLQLVSLVLLLGQHFILPAGIGLAQYGQFVFVVGSASLLFSAYDYGYNLLGIKKPRLATTYLQCKLLLLAAAGTAFLVAAWLIPSATAQRAVAAPVVFQAALYVLYTYLVNVELGAGRARRVVMLSICNGALLLGVPVAFHLAGIAIAYAPVAATTLSLAFALSLTRWRGFVTPGAVLTRPRFRWRHFRRSLVKQGQLSFGTIIDSAVVWVGVVAASSLHGFEAGAIYRLVMSAIALFTQIIPMPKQALLRVARSASSQGWARRYTGVLLLTGIGQVAIVLLAGRAAISWAFPASAQAIYHGVLVLSPVAALKTILEIETILLDRWNMLPRLVWNSLFAAGPALAAGLLLDVFWGILVFYLSLVVLSACAFRLENRGSNLQEGSGRAG